MFKLTNQLCLCGRLSNERTKVQLVSQYSRLFTRKSRQNANKNWGKFWQDKKPRPKGKPSAEFVPSSEFVIVQRNLKDLWKPAAFALGFSGCCFAAAALSDAGRARRQYDSLFDFKYRYVEEKFGNWRHEVNERWHNFAPSGGVKTIATILAANAAVLIGWRIPALRHVMTTYFVSGFNTAKVLTPMVLSVFSHYSLIHMGLNGYVLWSFGTQAIDHLLGVDQFWALYLSAGVLSSLAGIAHKAVTRTPAFALGASGAILGLLTYTCVKNPDGRLSIIFLPFFTFTAIQGVMGIVAVDAVGLVMGWRMFDHAAHLGGSLFGIWYATYGERVIWGNRHRFVKWWEEHTGRSL